MHRRSRAHTITHPGTTNASAYASNGTHSPKRDDGISAPDQRFTLSVLSMKRATLSCSCFSDGRCAYTMCPDGYHE